MYVCVCNAVSERAIRQAVAEGACTLEELQMRTGCATCCGCCAPMVEEVVHEAATGVSENHSVGSSGSRHVALVVSR